MSRHIENICLMYALTYFRLNVKIFTLNPTWIGAGDAMTRESPIKVTTHHKMRKLELNAAHRAGDVEGNCDPVTRVGYGVKIISYTANFHAERLSNHSMIKLIPEPTLPVVSERPYDHTVAVFSVSSTVSCSSCYVVTVPIKS